MPAQLQQMFGRAVLTPGTARNWVRSGSGRAVPPDLDAYLPAFLGASSRVYGFLRHEQFLRDLDQWVRQNTFIILFSTDPLGMLRNHVIEVEDRGGADTQQVQMFLTVYRGHVRIGRQQFCRGNPNRPDEDVDAARPVQFPGIVNFTAMRSNLSPARYALPTLTNAGNYWFTPIQTGCSVLICDWGGGYFSMIHLQPYHNGQYPGWLQSLFDAPNTIASYIPEFIRDRTPSWLTPPDSDRVTSEFKHFALRGNLNEVVDPLIPGPDRYILVQTSRTAQSENAVVMGIHGHAGWRFFCQRYMRYQHPATIIESIELEWRDWSDWVYRSAI
jgi:hypothetical protein